MPLSHRRKEIDQLLAARNLTEAVKRGLDFIEDFTDNRSMMNEMIGISTRYYSTLHDNQATEQCEALIQQMLQLLDKATAAHTPSPASERHIVFDAENLCKTFKTSNFKLDHLHIQLHSGEITGVIGPNANGKSTLLKIIVGDLLNDQGTLRYPTFEKNKKFPGWAAVKRQIAYIPQELTPWKGKLKEVLLFEASRHGLLGADCELRVDFITQRLGLSEYIHLDWNQLSGGYKLRFELAKALVWKPTFLVLDEPLANLDASAQLTILNDLRSLAHSVKHPIAVLITSQHIHEIEFIADHLVVLENGKIIYSGQPLAFNVQNDFKIAELSTSASYEEVTKSLTLAGIITDDRGYCLLLKIPEQYTLNEVIQQLLYAGIHVDYFRDITHSVKQIFYDVH